MMKRSGILSKGFTALAILAALGIGYQLGGHRPVGHDEREAHGEASAPAKKVQYTCGMHPFVIQDEPGLCPICGMQLTPRKDDAGGAPVAERKIKHWVSSMDATYIRQEPGKDYMGMDLVPVYEGDAAGGIAVDPVTVQSMGVRTEKVARRNLSRTIRTTGLLTYEEPRRFSVNSKIDGWVERLFINQEGQSVKKGQPLMEIYSPELVAAQQEYLLALKSYQRLADSSLPQVVDGARRLLEAARTRLSYWDIGEKQVAALEQSGQARKTLTLHSPYGGVVTMKKVLEGMRIMAGEELLQISDLSRIWVNADIYEYELPWIKVGQRARVELPFAAGKAIEGKIDYIYPYLQNETRTVTARIELANPGLELKPDMYANVSIATGEVAGALAIPVNAVLNSGKGRTVFVALGAGKFEPRAVTTGVGDDAGFVQVLSGLTEGDEVVVSAQFMLDSESKLREAIRKMTESSAPEAAGAGAAKKNDLDDLFE